MDDAVRNIMLWGSSSHAGYTSKIIENQGKYKIKFLYDPTLDGNLRRHGYRVLSGSLEELEAAIVSEDVAGVIVAIGNNFVRKSVALQIVDKFRDLKFVNAIHSSAIIEPDVKIGRGVVILAGAVIGPNTEIGSCSFLGTRSVVSHNSYIGKYANVLMGASIAGGVKIGNASVVSMGTSVIQDVKIGAGAVVGAGSLVLNNIPENVIAFGSPAEVVRDRPDNYYYL